MLSNISITDLKEETECTLTKSEDTTKPENATNKLNERAATQKHLGKLQEWVTRSLTKFSNGECKVLHLGWIVELYQCRLRVEWVNSSSAEKSLETCLEKALSSLV